jgi:hypothetical protein
MKKDLFFKVGLIAALILTFSQKVKAQANTTLSNLTPPTAINADLLPNTTNTKSLGASTRNWRTIYLSGDIIKGSSRFISSAGVENIFVGTSSGRIISSGTNNTAIGYRTLYFDTSGSYNTAVGSFALDSLTQGYYNTAVGANSLFSNIFGFGNTALGYQTLYYNHNGDNNVAIGNAALFYDNNGTQNIGIGLNALYNNTSGDNNVGVGAGSLFSNTAGAANNAIGLGSLELNTTGNFNMANGYEALYTNSSGSGNVANGAFSSLNNTTGSYNVSQGYQALYTNSTGNYNIAQGYQSLYSNASASFNIAHGYQALYHNTSGTQNTAQGLQALFANTTGGYNTAIGPYTLQNNTTNFYNTAIGFDAGYNNSATGTFLGSYASSNTGLSNVTAVGYSAKATASNQVRVGNTVVTSIGGQVGWTTFSDGRFKDNIRENVPGLTFINQLRPITYTLNVDKIEEAEGAISQNEGTAPLATSGKEMKQAVQGIKTTDATLPETPKIKMEMPKQDDQAKQAQMKIIYTGFVAQEVEQAAKKVNYNFSGVDVPKNDKDFYGLRYGDFVVPLVKAVQELSKKNEQLEEENQVLNDRLDKLEAIILGKAPINSLLNDMRLEQNRPNPFDHVTSITYAIPITSSSAQILITDNSGKMIKEIQLTGGSGTVNIDGSTFSSGEYNYSMVIDGKIVQTKKMIIAK